MKMLMTMMSKLESFVVRMAIISLRVYVNVKTPFHLLYNPLTIQNLSKFLKLAWGERQEGFVEGALPPGYSHDSTKISQSTFSVAYRQYV